jgi:hypothetical protein
VGNAPDQHVLIWEVVDFHVFASRLSSTLQVDALQWATRHLDILCLPVDLQVVIVQPIVSQDQALLPKMCDGKLFALQVVLIA